MKLFAFTAFCFLVFMTACDSRDLPPVTDTGGEVSFLLNGEEWAIGANVGAVEASYGYLIGASWVDPEGSGVRQLLRIAVADISKGEHPAATRAGNNGNFGIYGLFFDVLDGDAILASWEAVGAEAERGGIRVVDFDSTSGAVEIEFEGTLVGGRSDGRFVTPPDALNVADGLLRTTVYRPE